MSCFNHPDFITHIKSRLTGQNATCMSQLQLSNHSDVSIEVLIDASRLPATFDNTARPNLEGSVQLKNPLIQNGQENPARNSHT